MATGFYGVGIDTTTTSRIRTALERTPSLRDRLFTPDEQADARKRGPEGSDPWVTYLASAFAIKEAVAKAFGRGFGEITWNEIITSRNRLGKPEVRLAGNTTMLGGYLGIGTIHVSLTTEGDHVTAIALAERTDEHQGDPIDD